ncbi:MAG: DUF1326 domain-containing protein [Acidobacteriota bacterium]|nr:DUF1326 domain-containing protein [Acidobacteriota bacterium]
MRRCQILTTALFIACASLVAFASEPTMTTAISGDYVEARTASVFAGACHFNGEVVTTGRDAVVAWNVTSGKWNGVDLAGVRAIAVVTSDDTLLSTDALRRMEVTIDTATSEAQAAAFVRVLEKKYASSFGQVTSVHRARVTFRHEKDSYRVEAAGFASLNVDAMPNKECCKMPHLVWYAPLVPVKDRKVGYTSKVTYSGGVLGEAWERGHENSAFYGPFTL